MIAFEPMRVDGAESAADTVAPAALAAAKAQIRKRVLARRDALPADYRAAASRRIGEAILDLPELAAARVVMAYASFGTEVETQAVIAAALAQGKTLVMPRVNRGSTTLDLYRVRDPQRELIAGVWGIREPDPMQCSLAASAAIDFVLVPGVAFDRHGGRTGYGKGYYDRLLGERMARHPRPATVAAAFDVQLVESIPVEAHDVAVEMIITESRCFRCPRDGNA